METDKEEDATSNHKKGGNSIVGVKRPRTASEEQNPSVHVTYNSLTRNSKRKLEELLQQWSEWHAIQVSSSQEPNEVLESGEETYFPALCVGLKNVSAVSFRIDNQTLKNPNQESISLDSESAPLYDREFTLGLMSEDASKNSDRSLIIIEEASRCFNCGSYSHSLKECKKPRDSVAISSARKQHNTKRNHNNGPRLPTRYYQDTPAGKYDGLKPGVLDSKTQKLLGIGEFDPPPWLNRMREMGYPPGYLDPLVDDEPSGITIFGEEPPQQQEDGEILDIEYHEPPKKMSVGFPGINAPIPEKADERSWATGASNPDSSRNQSRRRHVVSSEEPTSIGHNHERRVSRAAFWDDGPPGVDPQDNPNMSSSYPPRYGSNISSYTSYSSRGTFPSSPRDSGLGRYENWSHERRNGYGYASDYSPSSHDGHHYYGRR